MPIKFVNEIKNKIIQYSKRNGLYIGCGNGRNYISLVKDNLDISGIDISKVAIDQLSKKIPQHSKKLHCIDFMDYNPLKLFDYIISIQIFQHGDIQQIQKYFEKSANLLRNKGLLFLRINSISTDIYFKHEIQQKNEYGGITIKYLEGPKKDMLVHFYSYVELTKLCENFIFIDEPTEKIMYRKHPKTGSWSQWELALQKK